ncbi:MAG: DUF6508 domain-containing protein, partial [Humidesulfovibrio sp.]|nr:DUF6508 domain-containing protein [Humidesulfovibrio sp.]
MSHKKSTLRERLDALSTYLPLLEAPGFRFGAWEQPSGVLPYYSYGKVASALVTTCYDTGWMLEGFDWVNWKFCTEACRLFDDRAYLADATQEQLARLLTTLIRQDRFCE